MANQALEKWARVFEAQRFDIVRRDPLQAHKEYATHHAVDVFINDDQVRLVVTRAIGETCAETRTSRAGREYRVFAEQNAVTIVNYRVRPDDDVSMILQEMEKEIAGR